MQQRICVHETSWIHFKCADPCYFGLEMLFVSITLHEPQLSVGCGWCENCNLTLGTSFCLSHHRTMTLQFVFKTYIFGSYHQVSLPHFLQNISFVPDCHGKPTHRFGSVDGAHHVWKTLIQKCNATSIEFESSFDLPSWNWSDLVLLEDTPPLVDAHATVVRSSKRDGIFADYCIFDTLKQSIRPVLQFWCAK